MKRKVRVYGLINLYETSAVGLPAYPDAHFSSSLSLTKSLSKFLGRDDEIIKSKEDKNQMTEKDLEAPKPEETKPEEEKPEVTEEKAEETPEEKPEEKPEEPQPEEKTEEEAPEKKQDVNELIAKAVKETVKETIKEMEAERGLVEKGKEVTEKSLGELTLEMFRRDTER